MSKNTYLSNSFEKGLHQDSNPSVQPPGTYTYALNAVVRDNEQIGTFGNENSNREFADLGSEIIGYGVLDERQQFVVFTRNGIYLVSYTGEVTFVVNDDEFGCDWNFDTCEWIVPEFKNMEPCSETFIYWSSGCEYFKLNLDEMLNPVRKQGLKDAMKTVSNQCSDITCEYFKVFKLSCAPRLAAVGYKTGGGSLLAGAYQFAVRLKNNEGGMTNWFTISDPIYIGGDHNEAGERTNGFIDINMSCLDCNYDYAELAVISTIGGLISSKLIGQFNYTNGKHTYTYMGNEGTPIALEEIVIRHKTYLQGKDHIQYNGNMFYYNIRQEKNLNYQRRANQIDTAWVRYEVPYEIASKYNLKTYMRGETYGFGIKFNSVDGRSTRVFHIPSKHGRDSGASIAPDYPVVVGDYTIVTQQDYKRTRSPIDDTVSNPQLDDLDANLRAQAEAIVTDINDIADAMNDCEDCPPAGSAAATDVPKINEIAGDVGAVVASLGLPNPDDLTVDYSPSTVKEAATQIFDAVEQRERSEPVGKKITVNKGTYIAMNPSTDIPADSKMSGSLFDCNGQPEIELIFSRVSIRSTIVSSEQDILYPDQKDCEGEYIYGDLANTPVRHHQVPWTSTQLHFRSTAVGVPSAVTPDADEYKEAFLNLIGPSFENIEMPTEEELGFKLCTNNPYTIVQIQRTTKNKTIHSKGIVTNAFQSSNDGKTYLYPTHAVNSEDSNVNRFININDSRRDPAPIYGENFNFWSLDTMTKAHALNVTKVKVEGFFSGSGYRHGLYEEGRAPADTFYGSQIDQRGTRQAINLNKFDQLSLEVDLTYKIYAPANEVVSPPSGAPFPLMNKYQQESVWFGAPIGTFHDRSFKGDVLDHSAPITDANAYYVALVRDLPNQYGDLTNMPYFPILEAGRNNLSRQGPSSIEGICGDTFIGPHSFVRTSYVSDKVGNKFPIGNMVPGKAPRCVCDTPEDTTHANSGQWVSTTLPKDGDKADPKNWAGLYTDGTSHPWSTANGEVSISDYYYPKTLKTLITYWGEFEVNPYMRQHGDLLSEQVYKPLSPQYGLDSTIDSNSGSGWDNDYLNQFYWEVEQPSKWKIVKKTLIRTILTIIAPMFGVDYILDGSSTAEFIESLGTAGFVTAVWLYMAKVLFTNHYIDEMFGIRQCRMDSQGGEKDLYINNFFQNFKKYNSDFSIQNKLEAYFGIPVPYYTCDCDDCDQKTTSEIYISDEQQIGSQLDAYSVIRPNNKINISATKGLLVDMFISGADLFAHTTEQIIPLRYSQVVQPSNLGEIILGTGPVLSKPVGYSEGIPEGFAGLISKQHAVNTSFGRFFIDSRARKVYQFKQGLEELSMQNLNLHFQRNLPFCTTDACESEHLDTNDLALGFDPKLHRLLITKRGEPDESWTVSFDLLRKQWISFHSYIPRFYMWDRTNMFSVDGVKMWVHDVKGNYQTFMGKYYPHILEFVINDNDILQEAFKGGIFNTVANQAVGGSTLNLLDRDVTFNKVWLRNNWQSSGYVDLVPVTSRLCIKEDIEERSSELPYSPLNKENGHWRYHQIRDLADNPHYPLFTKGECAIDIEPINLKPCSDSSVFKNVIQLNNYLYIRFILDNFADYKLYTLNHAVLVSKKPEFYG